MNKKKQTVRLTDKLLNTEDNKKYPCLPQRDVK